MKSSAWSHIVWGVTALLAMLWTGDHVLAGASPVPVGDESAHIKRAFELLLRLQEEMGIVEAFGHIFASDAYPNTLYTYTLLFFKQTPSMEQARLAIISLTACHAALGLTVGASLWGRPAALAYTAMACFSPVVLAYQQTYLIDVALISCVGITILFADMSNGFRRPLPSLLFIVAAALTLLTKWTALIWLGPATAWTCWAAASGEGATVRKIIRGAAYLSCTVVMGCVLIWVLASSDWVRAWHPRSRSAWVPLVVMCLGLVVAFTGQLRGRTTIGRAIAGISAIILIAGPWYTFRMPFLLDRLTHEAGLDPSIMGSATENLDRTIQTLRLLIPAGFIWFCTGIVGSVLTGHNRPAAWTRAIAATVAVLTTVFYLPFNVRYLLPAAPLIAGAAVAPWSALSRQKQWGLAAVVVSLVMWTGNGSSQSQDIPYTWSTDRAEVAGVVLPSGWGSPPSLLDEKQIHTVFATLGALCKRQPCRVNVTESQTGLQDRALVVMGLNHGLQLQLHGLCEGLEVPLEGLNQTLTVCEDQRPRRSHPAARQ